MSLIEAIEQSARNIAGNVPRGSRVAVVAFASHNANISDYIMEELTGALVERGLEVADRRNLPYLRQEFVFHMSGEVNDSSLVRTGNFLGANMIITGNLSGAGNIYRFHVNTIHLETGTHVGSSRFNVRNDMATQRMLAHIIQNPRSEHTVWAQKADEFRDSIEQSPHTAGMFFDRGVMHTSRGQYEPAVKDFSEVLERKPEMTSTYMVRATAHLGAGNLDEAMEDFNQVVESNARDALVYAMRGLRWRGLGEFDKAIADFETAIMLDPNDAAIRDAMVRTYVARAMKYRGDGDFERAIADLETALLYSPNDVGVRDALNRLRARQAQPLTPTDVTAVATSSNSITVSWSSVPGVTGYYIYRGASGAGSYSQVGTATSPSYIDTGLAANTTYYYKVAAYNDAGLGMQSSAVSATTQSGGVVDPWSVVRGTMTDTRDGKTYRTITIGSQTWMAENLNYNPGGNGSWCYKNRRENCGLYGRLYNWHTARNVCPVGWHLPSDDEWTMLVYSVGGNPGAGKKLKSDTGWRSRGNGTNDYGFSAMPGGGRHAGGFSYELYGGYWWSATESDANYAWFRRMDFSDNYVYWSSSDKIFGFSVRCVRD